MLYLSRKIGESIIINDTIEVTLVEVKGKTAKLGFTFPQDASILRKELYDTIKDENISAAVGGSGEDDLAAFLSLDESADEADASDPFGLGDTDHDHG